MSKFESTIDRLRKFDSITRKAASTQKSLKEQVRALSKDVSSQNDIIHDLRIRLQNYQRLETELRNELVSLVNQLEEAQRREYTDKEMMSINSRQAEEKEVLSRNHELKVIKLERELRVVKEQAALEQAGAADRVEELLQQQRFVFHDMSICVIK